MIIPIRCYSCGKLIGNKWEKYLQLLQRKSEEQEKQDRDDPENRSRPKPAPEKEVLDELGFNRYCCRRMMLTHVDLIEKVMNYNIYEKRGQQLAMEDEDQEMED
ncbi:NRPB10L [Symbiodinium sp. CCMP2592]|uniref:DNA-directed RNA polymerases I, II, and III subunit RPABC5 n=1 Tax=Symbiodinium necroappetens TaxID=1628268 RepID=A0A812TT57_9DINO|nr:NRPB10L [Symbiodinium sp. CCMP2592]CAE7541101.1 NRPB10L [Symbiodinium necroappetens]CAE7642183.1 NRPB10L [Symbiodinium sp. CCMP2456]